MTGHTGFKGAWLTLWLHTLGARVTGFSGPPPGDPSLFELARVGEVCDDRRGDVCDPDAVSAAVAAARPEIVFHLAAQPIVRVALADPAATYATNVIGTAHVLARRPRRGVVCVTSDKCYAPGEAPASRGRPARRPRPLLGLEGRAGARGRRRAGRRTGCAWRPREPAT